MDDVTSGFGGSSPAYHLVEGLRFIDGKVDATMSSRGSVSRGGNRQGPGAGLECPARRVVKTPAAQGVLRVVVTQGAGRPLSTSATLRRRPAPPFRGYDVRK